MTFLQKGKNTVVSCSSGRLFRTADIVRLLTDPSVSLSNCDDTMRAVQGHSEGQNEESGTVARLTSVWTEDVSHHVKTIMASGVCVELRWRSLDQRLTSK